MKLMGASNEAIVHTALGTLFTWGMTALGALVCALHECHWLLGDSRKLLDASLGFSAGVMLAASYFSLLSPAEEMALGAGYGNLSFVPLAIGVIAGAVFVFLADKYAPVSSFSDFNMVDYPVRNNIIPSNVIDDENPDSEIRRRHQKENKRIKSDENSSSPSKTNVSRRLLMMIIAITIHNIPEGLAVGVAFGAVGQSPTATLSSARNLALGIGIQNFPEGLAVSLPLKAAGMSLGRSVWYGQLSGLVEPIAGILGCLAVQTISPILPFALSFAAGSMIYVVFDDIIPESQQMGNGHLASIAATVGFVVMMCLDMGLG